MSDDRIDIMFGAQIAAMLAGLGEATAAVRESTESMKASLESLSAVGKTVQEGFLAVTAILAGGELFEGAIEKTAELGKQLEIGSQKTGMAVEELSRLRYAADLSDVSADTLMTSLQRLARGMEAAAKGSGPASDAFNSLGIRAGDAQGHLRPLRDVLLELADRFATMKDGAGKTALAMDLFGRAGAAMIPLLDQGRKGIAALEAEADRLGITMGGHDVDAANAYVDAMKQFHEVAESLERQLGLALMPTLTDIAHALTELAANSDVVKSMMGFVGGAVRLVVGTFVEFIGVIRAVNTVMSANILKASEFSAAWAKAKQEMEETGKAVRAIFDGTGAPTARPKHEGGDADAPAASNGVSTLEKFRHEWDALRTSQAENFGAMTQLELTFWQTKLDLVTKGSKDYIEIYRRITDLQAATLKEQYEGGLAAFRVQEASDKDHLDRVVRDRQAELQFIRAHYGEMSKEVQQGVARVVEAQKALENDTAKQWKAGFAAVGTAFSDAFNQIGKSVHSLRDLFRTAFADIVKMSALAGLQMVRDHVAHELAKKEITAESVAQRVAIDAWGAVQSVAKSAWAALINIGNYAAQAIAGAWAAISSIPYVGPFLAPVVAAGAGAAVLSLAGGVKSASGGFDIPAGLNPMTQLHAQEMVLPSELANRIRGMTGDGGGAVHVHLNVQAMDSKSVKQFLVDNHAAVGAAMKKAVKHGVFTSDGA